MSIHLAKHEKQDLAVHFVYSPNKHLFKQSVTSRTLHWQVAFYSP